MSPCHRERIWDESVWLLSWWCELESKVRKWHTEIDFRIPPWWKYFGGGRKNENAAREEELSVRVRLPQQIKTQSHTVTPCENSRPSPVHVLCGSEGIEAHMTMNR